MHPLDARPVSGFPASVYNNTVICSIACSVVHQPPPQSYTCSSLDIQLPPEIRRIHLPAILLFGNCSCYESSSLHISTVQNHLNLTQKYLNSCILVATSCQEKILDFEYSAFSKVRWKIDFLFPHSIARILHTFWTTCRPRTPQPPSNLVGFQQLTWSRYNRMSEVVLSWGLGPLYLLLQYQYIIVRIEF